MTDARIKKTEVTFAKRRTIVVTIKEQDISSTRTAQQLMNALAPLGWEMICLEEVDDD